MVEKLLEGSKRYYMWLLFLVALIAACFCVYLYQLFNGLGVTGMSRDVSWGLYISQFTYLVGVAASAVMLVLPTYFHHYQKFKIMIIFGEFMAIAAVIMCMLFVHVTMLGFSLAFFYSIDQNMDVCAGDPAFLRFFHLHLHTRNPGLMEFLNKFFCRQRFPIRVLRLAGRLQQSRRQHISRGSHTAVYI